MVLNEHYDESYFKPLQQRDNSEKWAAIYADRLAYLTTNAPAHKILEVGAGASTFALAAADVGFEVTVVDGAPWAVEFLTSHDGISKWVANLDECELPVSKFGAIHCSHVVEHLSNPRGFLERCKDSLLPGGVMHLSFPAYEGRILAIRDAVYQLELANFP